MEYFIDITVRSTFNRNGSTYFDVIYDTNKNYSVIYYTSNHLTVYKQLIDTI